MTSLRFAGLLLCPLLLVDVVSTTASWTQDPTDQATTGFGTSVASAGDVNGDGYEDVIVGAYQWDSASYTNEGRAYVYHGSSSGLSTTPDWTVDPADQVNAYFGFSVAAAGDVNNDGYGDVVVGAYGLDANVVDEGRIWLYLGSATGLSTTAAGTWDPVNQLSSHFGYAVAGAGDVNRDGYDDVVVGAYKYDSATFSDEGLAYVFHGAATGLASTAAWSAEPANNAGALFGSSVASAGDVNGDGYADVIIGAPRWDDGTFTDEGRAYVYHGSSSGLSTSAAWTVDPADQTSAYFGSAVSGGDINGDGYSDVAATAPVWDSGGVSNEGRAYAYHGSSSGLSTTAAWTLDPTDQADASFGSSIAIVQDYNANGYRDCVVGANLWDGGATGEGRVYCISGSSSGLGTTVEQSLDPTDLADGAFGTSVAGADVNGDGNSDLLTGAPGWDGAATDEGRAYAFHSLSTSSAPKIQGPATPLPSGTTGTALTTVRFRATGAVAVTWSVTAGSLPTGMTLSSAGVYSGTPTLAGSYSFTISATNTIGTDARAYTQTISDPPPESDDDRKGLCSVSSESAGSSRVFLAVLAILGGVLLLDWWRRRG